MNSDTITRSDLPSPKGRDTVAIKNSEIAERLRAIRLLSDVSAEEMAEVTGLSLEEYKDLENNKSLIPVSVLLDACDHLKISMTELLTGETAKLHIYAHVKNGKGLAVERTKAYKYENLAFNFADRKVEPLLVTVESNEDKDFHLNSHSGQEFHYCLEGRFILKIDKYEVTVEQGDSVYFNSLYPHGMKALDGKSAKILVVTI